MPVKILIPTFLLLCLAALHGCKKKNTDPSYTGKMGGVRHCHGHHFYESIGTHTYENYDFTDTLLTIIAVDGSTVYITGDTLVYQSSDPANKSYNFRMRDPYGPSPDSLIYYYDKDSIEFHHEITRGTWQLRNDYYTN